MVLREGLYTLPKALRIVDEIRRFVLRLELPFSLIVVTGDLHE